VSSREKIGHFLIRHRLPPIWIENPYPSLQSPEHSLFATRFLGAHDVHYGNAPAADSDRFPVLGSPDELWQFVLGIGYADLHSVNDSHVG